MTKSCLYQIYMIHKMWFLFEEVKNNAAFFLKWGSHNCGRCFVHSKFEAGLKSLSQNKPIQ